MTEREAEAALLALGSSLDWRTRDWRTHEIGTPDRAESEDWAETDTGYYSVQPLWYISETFDRLFLWWLPPTYAATFWAKQEHSNGFTRDERRLPYRSRANAKAACERHHASRMQGNREAEWK